MLFLMGTKVQRLKQGSEKQTQILKSAWRQLIQINTVQAETEHLLMEF